MRCKARRCDPMHDGITYRRRIYLSIRNNICDARNELKVPILIIHAAVSHRLPDVKAMIEFNGDLY